MNFNNVEFLISAAAPKDFPKSRLPEIAFAGKSNVGKSSVINRILNRKNFARVGDKPGKTIHVNYFTIDSKCYFVDLPGYGYAKVNYSERERWSELMEGYFKSGRDIRMAFQLIDMRHPATDFDLSMIDFLSQMGIPYTVVLTKADKLNKTETENRLRLIKEELGEFAENTQIIPFSVQNSIGAEELRNIINMAILNG